MRAIKTYAAVVDIGRPKNLQRTNSRSRWYAGAKDEKEAMTLLRQEIKFGSIQIIGADTDDIHCPYKQVMQAKKGAIANHEQTATR